MRREIARRGVLSDNALSVLVPILEETLGWNALQIRDLFTSCGVAIHEWDKIRTDWLTFHQIPTPFVVHEAEVNGSNLPSDPRFKALIESSAVPASL